jgi:hypothetical protein
MSETPADRLRRLLDPDVLLAADALEQVMQQRYRWKPTADQRLMKHAEDYLTLALETLADAIEQAPAND